VKSKNILSLAVVLALFFSGCASGKIRICEPGSASDAVRDENGRLVPEDGLICFSVYGKDQKLIIAETLVYSSYRKNLTVAELSRDLCREINIPIVFAGVGAMVYVSGINNLFEFDHGAESGWIYAVNGEYQNVGCGSYILKDRDYVEWHYTLDLGRDLGAYELDE
jgi:hypothetical protein